MLSLLKRSLSAPYNGRAMSSLINLTMDDKTGIAKVEMNCPPVNSMSSKFMEDLLNKVEEAGKLNCRGMLLASGNKDVFSAGLNLSEIYQADPTAFRKFYYLFQEVAYQLYKAPFLTATAINGHSPAGGCVMALTTDYRVMVNNQDKQYRIGLNESALGIAAPVWVQQLMIDVIGRRQATQALLSSTLFTTEEAFRIGLIDEMATDPRDAVSKAESYLDMYRDMPILSVIETKINNRKEFLAKFESQREFDIVNFSRLALGPVAQGIVGKFLESRKK